MNLRVRYAETDNMGVVHHANYLIWFESARTEYIRELGFPYRELEAQGYLLPVLEVSCQYKAPARYDDVIEVIVKPIEISPIRVTFFYQCFLALENKLLVTGQTKHAWLNKNWRPVNIERIYPNLYRLLKEQVNQEKKVE